MNNVQALSPEENNKVSELIKWATEWASEHQVAVGVTEIALGSAAIAFGVNTGCIEIGGNIVTTLLDNTAREVGIGSAIGGGVAGMLIGGIGVAACGGAIGIPAVLVVGGAAWVFGASGYTLGSEIVKLLNPIDWGSFGLGCSLLTVGLALILDGIRRVMPDCVKEAIKHAASTFVNGVIFLGQCVTKVIADSLNALTTLYTKSHNKILELAQQKGVKEAVSTTVVIGGAAGGAAIGTAAAASTVTVLGSSTLGSVALGLGLVSAPLWPVIAIGAGGAIVGVGILWALKSLLGIGSDEDALLADLLVKEQN